MKLTKRETDVLLRMSLGDRTKQAAHVLGLSVRTVEKYRMRAMKKLAAKTQPHAIRLAIETGYLR